MVECSLDSICLVNKFMGIMCLYVLFIIIFLGQNTRADPIFDGKLSFKTMIAYKDFILINLRCNFIVLRNVETAAY